MSNAEKFRVVEARIRLQQPNIIDEAEELADNIVDPATSGPDDLWRMLWDKPLFANTRVQTGLNAIARLGPFAAGDKWRVWGDPDKQFLTLSGPANRDSSFAFTQFAPQGLDGLRIAKNRLYAIQGAAQALRRWTHSAPETPLAFLSALDGGTMIATVQPALGVRWGHITVMHFLTDLGLFCKPDRWLVRTTNWLGLVDGDAVDMDSDTPSLREAILIDAAVKQLVRDVDGILTPRRLRYFDKILMDASRQNVLTGPLLPVS